MTDTTESIEMTMSGAEFRILREYLGLTNAWLGDYLGVAERSVNRWGDGEIDPPPGVVQDMFELEDIAACAVDDACEALELLDSGRVWHTWRTDAAVLTAHPQQPYPASWHRAIAARIRERVPGLRIEFHDPKV